MAYFFSRMLSIMLLSWCAATASAQVPIFEYAVACGGTKAASQSQNRHIVADKLGNTYITGMFRGSLELGSTTLTSVGDYDVFVAKLNAAGTYLWAVQAGGYGEDISSGIALDANNKVHITGYCKGNNARFGTQPLFTPTDPYTDGMGYNLFVASLTTDGRWERAVRAGGRDINNYLIGTSLAMDSQGNTYVSGGFRGQDATFGTTRLADEGFYNVFVACLAANGTWRWAVGSGGNGYGFAQGIAVDNQDGVFLTGSFNSNGFSLGALRLPNPAWNNYDGFLARLSATTGAAQWLVPIAGPGSDVGSGLAVDSRGDAYLTGTLSGGSAVVGNVRLTKATADNDLFVARFDGPTGTCRWATRGGGPLNDTGGGIALDEAGLLYIAGSFASQSADFGPVRLRSAGMADVVTASLTTAGQWRWAVSGGGPGDDYGTSVAADGKQGAYVAGTFQGAAITFGATTLQTGTPLSASFLNRGFVARATDVALRSPAADDLVLWPNPGRRGAPVWATGLTAGQPLELFDATGRRVIADARPAYQAQGLALPASLAGGVYLLRSGKQTRRLILTD